MYIKVNNKKIEILEYTRFKERIKSLRFVLDKIDYGVKLPNKRVMSTYLFCQRVDVCITDQEDIIVGLQEDVKSEKRKILWGKYNVYYLPLDTVKHLKLGDKIKEIKE